MVNRFYGYSCFFFCLLSSLFHFIPREDSRTGELGTSSAGAECNEEQPPPSPPPPGGRYLRSFSLIYRDNGRQFPTETRFIVTSVKAPLAASWLSRCTRRHKSAPHKASEQYQHDREQTTRVRVLQMPAPGYN